MSTSTSTTKDKRAIGIVRVSEVGGREGDSFVSPRSQRDAIAAYCEREGLRHLETLEELDVSGGKPLSKRPGLSAAIEAVEAGRADVIVVAYFDRLARSERVRREVVERIEAAGGDVLTLDAGTMTNGGAARKLTSAFLGAVAEYHLDTIREKSADGQEDAVRRGAIPIPTPVGYRRTATKGLEPDPTTGPLVAEAFRMRAAGASHSQVREYLREHGVTLSVSGVARVLGSQVYRGTATWKGHTFAIEPLTDSLTFRRANRQTTEGRRVSGTSIEAPTSLLARLGVLRCRGCGSRMVYSTKSGGRNPFYRCPGKGADCGARASISAAAIEPYLIEQARTALEGYTGQAGGHVAEASAALTAATETLDVALELLGDLSDPKAVQRLREAKAARAAAKEAYEAALDTCELTGRVQVNVPEDWAALTLPEVRELVAAALHRVDVAKGEGLGRVQVTLGL